ncbi:MAG: restriction endonuclease subunit S [Microbacteriaceae bacterium]|nr:restriction endonuclease subunit S [Microbacteriaceae bacterium]
MMDFEGRAHYPISLETLPRGWLVEFLGDICTSIQAGFASGEHNAAGDGIPHVRPMNINRLGHLVFDQVKYVSPAEDERRLMRGDVVFNNTNSPVLIGKTGAVSTDKELAFSNHMTRLRPVDGLDHRFLSSQLHYLWMTGFFLHRCVKHVNQASVSSETLGATVPVVLPPPAEQHRIVSALESYFTRLDDAVATLERVQRNLKRYRASVLKAAVEGRLVPTEAELARAEGRSYEPASVLLTRILAERRRRWEEAELARMTAKGKAPKDDKWKARYVEPVAPDTSELPELPEGWCWATLDVLATVKGGITKGQKPRPGEVYREVPYLRVANVQRGFLDLQHVKTIQASEATIDELRLEPGDVLFNEGGDRDKLGRGWIWKGEISECIHQNHVFRARLHTDDVQPELLSWYGNTAGQRYFFDEGKHTTNLASINLKKLRALPVPVPPRAEQVRIRTAVERQVSVVDDTLGAISRELARCARLRQSILKWAFEGRLVDQDPSDEPASVLLDRIRGERAASTKPSHAPGGGRDHEETAQLAR